MMYKKRVGVVFLLVVVMFFVGCSGVQPPNAGDANTAPVGSRRPTRIDSIEGFHNYLLSARAFASSGVMPFNLNATEEMNVRTAVGAWNLGDAEYYFVPSWLPEGFTLFNIGISHRSAGFRFASGDFVSSPSWDHENILNNNMVFEWHRDVAVADAFMEATVARFGLQPVAGVNNLYFEDFGLYFEDFGAEPFAVDLRRSYYWVQGEYRFMLSIPLWIIAEYGEALVNELVMNSALAVELVDGQYYVEPTGIEIVAAQENEAVEPLAQDTDDTPEDAPQEDTAESETLTLTANVSPGNATINAVIWSTSDNSVATVTQEGVVTRVGEGSATITARTLVKGHIRATFELDDGIIAGDAGEEDDA